jgi:sugar-specific transcriptional regulator TrmB/CBS domain-containing protein
LSDESIVNVLRKLGLPKREIDIYLFLSKYGMKDVKSVSTHLKIERVQTYRTIKSLEDKGIVEATLETPTRYKAVPLDTLLESHIKARKTEVDKLELEKQDVIARWKNLTSRITEHPVARYRVLTDQRRTTEEISNLIKEAQEEILHLATSQSVIQEDLAGVLDTTMHAARKTPKIQFKNLATISRDNQEIVRKNLKEISGRKLNMEWRHIDISSRIYPQFIVKDAQEAILYVSREDNPSAAEQEQTGLWISSKMFASALKESFMEMWRNATPAEDRLRELETGKPTEKTYIIRDPTEAEQKLAQTMQAAKQHITAIMPATGINQLAETNPFRDHVKSGLRFRIMAPIDLDNFEAAEALSKTFEITSVPISYLSMLTVDNEHAFIFKTPSKDQATTRTPFQMDNTFYTNDSRYVERVAEMLEDIWKRGIDIQTLIQGPPTMSTVRVSGTDPASKIVDLMLRNNLDSVIVADKDQPIGLVTHKDLLQKVVRPRKDPDKTKAKDIMSLPIVTVDSEEPLTKAYETMRRTGINKVAVLKKGKLAGMLTLKTSTKHEASARKPR